MSYDHGYPNEPIGGGNPYYRCVHCKISDPEINGRLEKHASWCEYRKSKQTPTFSPDLEALMPEPGYAVNNVEKVYFTADQVRETMQAATERAAKVCDSMSDSDYSPAQCAAAIRGAEKEGAKGS